MAVNDLSSLLGYCRAGSAGRAVFGELRRRPSQSRQRECLSNRDRYQIRSVDAVSREPKFDVWRLDDV
jgi:hypothetical protein